MERREPSYTIGGNVNWYKPLWRAARKFLKKLKTKLPYDPVITLLGIYPEQNMSGKHICPPIFIAALFSMAKTWKQLKCPSTEEWIKKMRYVCVCVCVCVCVYIHTHNGILPKHSKEWNKAFAATCVDLESVHPEWSKSDREYHMTFFICAT